MFDNFLRLFLVIIVLSIVTGPFKMLKFNFNMSDLHNLPWNLGHNLGHNMRAFFAIGSLGLLAAFFGFLAMLYTFLVAPVFDLIPKREPNGEAIRQFQEYLTGNRKEFTIPLHQLGTPFQLLVWEELLRIPYGETRTYGDIATKVENLKGQRAVGMANHKNPIAVLVPCHRVIGKNGTLTGYAGGLDIKQRLLELEGAILPLISERTEEKSLRRENMEKIENKSLFIGVEHIGIKAVDLEKALCFSKRYLALSFYIGLNQEMWNWFSWN